MDSEYYSHFSPLSPAEDKLEFVNRSMLLDSLVGYLRGEQLTSSLVVGGRRSGKTSALWQLRHLLTESTKGNHFREQIVPVYVDLMEYTPESEDKFYRACIRSLAAVVSALPTAERDSPLIGGLLADYQTRVNQSDELQLRAFEATVAEAIQGLDADYGRIVFLIDEFDIILGWDYSIAKPFFQHLCTILRRPKTKIGMVLAGSYECYEVVAGPVSPLQLILKIHYLEPFNSQDTEQLIMHLQQNINSSYRFTQDDSNLVFDRTGGHPYLIQCIMHSSRALGASHVTESALLTIENENQFKKLFRLWYDKLEERDRWLYAVLAECDKERCLTVAQLFESTPGFVDFGQVHSSLQKMISLGIISLIEKSHRSSDDLYGISGTAFRDWFTETYPGVLLATTASDD
jgi:hypothetical protein